MIPKNISFKQGFISEPGKKISIIESNCAQKKSTEEAEPGWYVLLLLLCATSLDGTIKFLLSKLSIVVFPSLCCIVSTTTTTAAPPKFTFCSSAGRCDEREGERESFQISTTEFFGAKQHHMRSVRPSVRALKQPFSSTIHMANVFFLARSDLYSLLCP